MIKYFLLFNFLFASITLIGQSSKIYSTQIKKGQLKEWLSIDGNNQPIIAAHRGGRFLAGYPENALETFEYVLTQTPALIECDVEMTSDSTLVMLHDQSLDRTTTGTGKIKSKTWAEIEDLQLVDDFGTKTNFEIPLLEEALKWCRKKTILELDVKRGVPFDKVVKMVENYKVEDYVLIITYNLKDAQEVYRLNPNLLISVSIRNEKELEQFKNSGIPFSNLIAFTGTRFSDEKLYQNIHEMGSLTIIGTMGNLDNQAKTNNEKTYIECINKGINVIATDRPIEAAKALKVVPEKNQKFKNYSIRKRKRSFVK